MKILKSIFMGAALIGLAGCGTIANQIGGKPLANNIDEDAVRLNNSHARAINGVITVNILRARDRWPTGYTTLSGVLFNPMREFSGGVDFNQTFVPESAPLRSRLIAELSGSGTLTSNAQYSVNPFADQNTSRSLYSAEPADALFRRYIESGWPAEVLFPLFVGKVTTNDGECEIEGDHDLAKALNSNTVMPVTHPCHSVYNMLVQEAKWEYLAHEDLDCTSTFGEGDCKKLGPADRRDRDEARRQGKKW